MGDLPFGEEYRREIADKTACAFVGGATKAKPGFGEAPEEGPVAD